MSTDRLSHLQNLIEIYYAQLEGKENTLATIAGEERVTILHGQGGIGKTSLAVKLMAACGVNPASGILHSYIEPKVTRYRGKSITRLPTVYIPNSVLSKT